MKKVYCTSIWCDINSCDWTISKTLARSNISLVVLALSKTPHETVRVVVNTYTILNNMYIPTSRIICMVMHCEANASSVVFESHLDAIHHLKEYQLQDLQGFWKSVSPWSRFTTAPAETAPAFQFRVKTNHKSAKPSLSPVHPGSRRSHFVKPSWRLVSPKQLIMDVRVMSSESPFSAASWHTVEDVTHPAEKHTMDALGCANVIG